MGRTFRCALATGLAAVSASGCSSTPGNPEYAELGLSAADTANVETARECVPLPILPGATVVKDLSLAPGLLAHVRATRDSADIELSGMDDPHSAERFITEAELLAGVSDAFDVTTSVGGKYTVHFFSPCTPPVPVAPGK